MSRDKGKERVNHPTLHSLICWVICQHVPDSPIDDQLQSGLLPQSVMQSWAARGWSADHEHRGWWNLLSTNEGSPSWYWASHESFGPSLSSLAPSTVAAPVCRSYRKRIVDLAGTWSTVQLFPYSTNGFHLDILRMARRSRSLLWNTTAGDWCSATARPERCAVQWQAVTAVRCQRLCKKEQQRLYYLQFNQNSLCSWHCSGELRRSRRHRLRFKNAYSL